MTQILHTERQRIRSIVKLASERTEITEVRSWLFSDERGTWEKQAADLLEKSAARATELGMSVEQVDDQIADYILLLALDATLRNRKSG